MGQVLSTQDLYGCAATGGAISNPKNPNQSTIPTPTSTSRIGLYALAAKQSRLDEPFQQHQNQERVERCRGQHHERSLRR